MNKKIAWGIGVIILVFLLVLANKYVNNKSYVEDEVENFYSEDTIKNHEDSTAEKTIIQVTSKNFEEVVMNSGKTVMIDFYADRCPPCKALAPIIDEVASENQDENLVFVRINTDDEERISNEFNIQSIPTLVLMKDGKEVDRSIGYIGKEEVKNFVNGK